MLARTRGRQIAGELGFLPAEQTRIATAVSEIARNAFRYAGSGTVTYAIEENEGRGELVIRVADRGKGIANLDEILAGRYRSMTGMGIGLAGAKRLVDRFEILTSPANGTKVAMWKTLPGKRLPTQEQVNRAISALTKGSPESPFEEMQQQNRELIRALEDVESRQSDLMKLNGELERLNRELEDTNRAVIVLNSELDDRAENLHKALETRTRILSYMSHEVRTPINAVLQLSELLLNGTIAQPLPDQEKPLSLIRTSAEELSQIVDDLLDLGRAQAGKLVVRRESFELSDLFATIRGIFRPIVRAGVSLVVDEPHDVPTLETDAGKVAQIVRNLVSNALKFTTKGEVRVSAWRTDEGCFEIRVSDTGVGIAPADQEKIFEEYGQVDNPMQRSVKGTGLGLPLARRYAMLLGGRISVESAVGAGTTFRVSLPFAYVEEAHAR